MILHFCATSTDVIKNFAVIKSVIVKRAHCTFKKLLDKHKIDMYSTFNEGKAVVIE